MNMKIITKSQFKPKAFEYFRMVEEGQMLIITDHGRPVAKIIPFSGKQENSSGSLSGSVRRYDNPFAPVGDADWDADK